MVDDESADHEPETAADRRERREQADAPGNAVARELVADDPEAEREDAAADALHDTAGDDDPERRPERRDDRSRGEGEQRDHEQPALAEHVAEPSDEGRADRGREQVARHRPRDAARVGVQLARELRDRRDQGRLSERERERGHTEDQERPDGVRARGVGGRHRRRWIASRKPIGDDPRNEP